MASAYEAIIKIGVQGQQELDRALNKVELLNKAISGASSGERTIQSLQAYNTVLKETANNLRFVELGTKAEAIAVKQYVSALGNANSARERQNKLIDQEIAKRKQLANIGRYAQDAAGRRAELSRTGGLSFDERLAQVQARRPAPRQPLFRGDRQQAIQGAAIGGGFPLLFGQGTGASVGGLIGGGLGGALTGSGAFAGGIVGSLIGTQFDKVKQSAIGMAEALREPTALLEAMGAAGITTSSALKNTVAALEGLGRGAEAQQLVFAELERLGGTDYVQNLLELEEANKALQEAWSQLSVTVQKELLPYFIELTNAATALTKPLALLAQGLSGILPVLDALLTAAVPFGVVPLVKNLGNIAAGPGGAKKEDSQIRTPEISDTQQRKALDEAIARQKEAEDLRRRGIQLELSQADFRRDQEEAIFSFRKRADDYTREVAEFRRGIEDKIFDKQQANARTLADLTRQQAQNAIERRDQSLEPLGRISPLEGGGRAAGVDLVREYIRARAEGEADLQQKETETQLKIQEIRRDSDKFRLDVEKKVYEFQQKAEQFARDVTKYEFETAKKVYALEIEAADYAYAMWENAYKRATEISQMMREAAANPLGDMTGGGEGPVIGGTAGLRQGIERIKGAYSFRGTTLAQNKRPGDYQSDPRENFFFDFQPRQIIEAAKRRVGTLTSGDIAALTLTVLTEAGPTSIGKFDVAANLISRSAMAGNQPISRIAAAPGQYEGVFSRGLTPRQLEDPAVGRRLFGSAFDTWFRRFGGFGKGSEATTGTAANALGTPIGATVGGTIPAQPTAPVARPTLRQGGIAGANLPQLPSAPNVDALVRTYTGLNEQQTQLLQGLQEEAAIRTRLADLAGQSKLDEGVAAIGQQFLQPLLDARQAAEDKLNTEKEYADLINAGVLPALAEQLSQADQLEKTQLRLLDIQIKNAQAVDAELQARIEINRQTAQRTPELNTALTNDLAAWRGNRRVLQGLGDTRAGIIGLSDQQRALIQQGESPEARLKQATITAQEQLNTLTDPANQIITAANGIGDAFGTAFKDIASGSKSAQQALSNMFSNIANSFLDMAAQMLAQQATLGILKLFGGALTGGGGGGGLGVGGFSSGILGLGGGALGYAKGGDPPVGRPSLVGEKGPELFIPRSRGTIIPASETRAMLEQGTSTLRTKAADEERQAVMASTQNSPLQVEWKKIGDMEVVTRDEFIEGMNITRKQAAKEGQARVVSSMRRDPAFRREMR